MTCTTTFGHVAVRGQKLESRMPLTEARPVWAEVYPIPVDSISEMGSNNLSRGQLWQGWEGLSARFF